jgi:hypothetical protein
MADDDLTPAAVITTPQPRHCRKAGLSQAELVPF